MNVKKDFTPVNFTQNGMRQVRGIVLHSMWGTYAGSIAWFKNPTAQASAHYLISKTGEITQMVKETDMAWHAGIIDEGKPPSYFLPNPNWYTIGIELEDEKNANWQYPEAQRKATEWLVKDLMARYALSKDRIWLHKQLVPSRRSDPVGAFSMGWVLPEGGGNMQGDYYQGYDLTNKESMKVAVDVMVRVQKGEFINKNDIRTYEIDGHQIGWYITELANREDQVNRLKGEKDDLQKSYDALKKAISDNQGTVNADKELIKKLQEEASELAKQIGEKNHEIELLQQENDALNTQIEELKAGGTGKMTLYDVFMLLLDKLKSIPLKSK